MWIDLIVFDFYGVSQCYFLSFMMKNSSQKKLYHKSLDIEIKSCYKTHVCVRCRGYYMGKFLITTAMKIDVVI
jgi:hypothetical protein